MIFDQSHSSYGQECCAQYDQDSWEGVSVF